MTSKEKIHPDTGRRNVGWRAWTSKEDKKLAELWRNTPVGQVSSIMGRSTSSVWNRVRKLKLGRDPEYRNLSASGRFGGAGGSEKKAGRPPLRPGEKSNTWRPIGAERTTKYGILERKVADTGDKRTDWRAVHVMNWEAVHGPVPSGKFLIFKDRNKENRAVDNLLPVTRTENMQRNSITNYGADYQSVAITLGKLKSKIKEVENEVG